MPIYKTPRSLAWRFRVVSLPRSPIFAMVKQGRAKKQERLGTGMVTPMQIAFIVDRYLSDNSYSETLSNFRAEASDLLSRTHGKEVPKGLMGLADILDDYVRLKEQRLAMDREKQRIEAAMKGMQDVIRLYHSETVASVSASLATSLPQIIPSPTVPLLSSSNPRNGSHLENMSQGVSVMNMPKPPLLRPMASNAKFSAPARTQSYAEKRKASKLKDTPMKKLRTHSANLSNIEQGLGFCSQEACKNRGKSLALSESGDDSTIKPPLKGLPVVKELFRHPDNYQSINSPKTPQPLISQMENFLSPSENSVINAVEGSCSLISSETIIISPLKSKGYYTVERSYQVTCSPLKTSATKLGKRENVKGRLDFDKADALEKVETPCPVVDASTSPSEDETPGGLEFDLPDFEIFDGDFLSGLLVDFDDQNEEFSGSHPDVNSMITGPGQCTGSGCLETVQVIPDSSVLTTPGSHLEGIRLQGYRTNFEEAVMV